MVERISRDQSRPKLYELKLGHNADKAIKSKTFVVQKVKEYLTWCFQEISPRLQEPR